MVNPVSPKPLLNTHAVANGGLLSLGFALALHIAHDVIANGGLHVAPWLVILFADLDANLGTPLLAGGAFAAYFGRPPTVPE